MQNLNRTAIIYYSGTVVMSIGFCLALIAALSWPVLAEIPLSISIFIQLLFISRSIFNFIERTETKSVEEVYSKLKSGGFETKTIEEANYAEH